MTNSTLLLPQYHKYLNGAPVPFSRRTRRNSELCLVALVFISLSVICFGALFYLPEFKATYSGTLNNVYKQIQNAGPELLLPARSNARHDGVLEDPHAAWDKEALSAKIEEEDSDKKKVLERPDLGIAFSLNNITGTSLKTAIEHVETSLNYGDNMLNEKRNTVKAMMKHGWDNYVKYAWGKNELKPVSKREHSGSVFGSASIGATIVDSLDTLLIMGLNDEYKRGRDWVANNFTLDNVRVDISVFETNIRYIGGFLSCYAMTGDTIFRDKAVYVANKLLPAFQTPTGIPYSLVNLKTGSSKNYFWASGGSSILSEFGTLHLEFVYLSDITGNDIYRQKVEHIRDFVRGLDRPNGLYPNFLNPVSGKWGQRHVSLGGLGDSFYEYLLKAYIQSNGEDTIARDMFDDAMASVMDNLVQTSASGLTYLADMRFERIEHKMDHLSCFAGGMFALAGETLGSDSSKHYTELGAQLTETCHVAYDKTATKLGPEAFRFTENYEAVAVRGTEKYNILRPETVESYFVLWRLTHNNKYRDWAWEAVQAFEKHCKVSGGYTGIKDVYQLDSLKDDVQQSYFFAETLKYLYLIFSDDTLIPLENWVFNSEAHPLPVKVRNKMYRHYNKD
ncbi:mannosyl-oligosaccharide alpha-1,2-mannosidase IA [Adelges cooleyi]|uniref:mannosyl-oligosaccharide alpha-1,2-mannosidase IA n=1 Tax=Adelges cooleyi TaxID=133065 RepID=UPI00217FAA3A|nr:mannosyl-oligosaccharide alpha-1,2-mannosidase IA [Adelges cooleyi]